MYEVEANCMTCEFEKESDAINAFEMALGMVENIDFAELDKKIKQALT